MKKTIEESKAMFGPFASIEDVPSRYQFVHVVARRARKLQGGARPLVATPTRKFTRVAQQEAMGGHLDFTFLNANLPADGKAAAEE